MAPPSARRGPKRTKRDLYVRFQDATDTKGLFKEKRRQGGRPWVYTRVYFDNYMRAPLCAMCI